MRPRTRIEIWRSGNRRSRGVTLLFSMPLRVAWSRPADPRGIEGTTTAAPQGHVHDARRSALPSAAGLVQLSGSAAASVSNYRLLVFGSHLLNRPYLYISYKSSWKPPALWRAFP